MILPGKNKLVLNQEAMRRMLEDAINAATMDGEDYIYVTRIDFAYVANTFEIELTTDREKTNADQHQ